MRRAVTAQSLLDPDETLLILPQDLWGDLLDGAESLLGASDTRLLHLDTLWSF